MRSGKHNLVVGTELSTRIDLLRFPLIVGVVLLHSYDATVAEAFGATGDKYAVTPAAFACKYISHELAPISVPLFFLISGLLFFRNFDASWQTYSHKLRSRAQTLLVPFLLWNVGMLSVVAVGQSVPALAQGFSGKVKAVATFGPFDYLNAIFGLTDFFPIAYHLWFIRDLMVLVLLTPLLYLMLRHLPRWVGGILLLIWVLPWCPRSIPSCEALAFFYVGGMFGCGLLKMDSVNLLGKWSFLAYIPLSLLAASTAGHEYSGPLHRSALILGLPSVYWSIGLAARSHRFKQALLTVSPAAFFVFLTHEPLLAVVRKLSYRFMQPTSDWTILILHGIDSILVITACASAFFLLRRIAPRLTAIIAGGRICRPSLRALPDSSVAI